MCPVKTFKHKPFFFDILTINALLNCLLMIVGTGEGSYYVRGCPEAHFPTSCSEHQDNLPRVLVPPPRKSAGAEGRVGGHFSAKKMKF